MKFVGIDRLVILSLVVQVACGPEFYLESGTYTVDVESISNSGIGAEKLALIPMFADGVSETIRAKLDDDRRAVVFSYVVSGETRTETWTYTEP